MRVFRLVLIKPSHYDDAGYVIQFVRSAMPSNTLAALCGLATDCAERHILGDDVEFRLTMIDETNTRVRVKKLARMIKREGGNGLVSLVGVQTNQYPRALDLARQFREEGVQVAIGGFHVSGTLAMLPEITPELQEAFAENRVWLSRELYDNLLALTEESLAELADGLISDLQLEALLERRDLIIAKIDRDVSEYGDEAVFGSRDP